MATLRKSCCCTSCTGKFKARFTEIKRSCTSFEDGSEEIAVSSVDLMMSDAFIRDKAQSSSYSSVSSIGGNFNKDCLWETVLEELENTCLSKVERIRKRERFTETVYTVPVIGYKQFPPVCLDDDYMLGCYHSLCTENPTDEYSNLNKSLRRKIKRNPAQVAAGQ